MITCWVASNGLTWWILFRGVGARTENSAAIGWARRHLDVLRVAGVVVALLLLLTLSLNIWGTLIVLAVLAVFEVGLHRLRPHEGASMPPWPGCRISKRRGRGHSPAGRFSS